MAVLLALLYNTHAVNLAFHEIAGLFIFGLFVIHCVFNAKWIKSVTKKLFGKKLPARTRFIYILDFLLVVSFLMIILSGIFISKELFPSISVAERGQWKSVHYFFSAISIILAGIHIGLHWKFVQAMSRKIFRIPGKILKPMAVGAAIVLAAFGIYNLASGDFASWLGPVFTHDHEIASAGSGGFGGGRFISEISEHKFSAGKGLGRGGGGGHVETGTFAGALSAAFTIISVLAVFAILAYYLDKFVQRKKALKKRE